MDNSKKNIHNSGPLGMLMRNGQIKKIEEKDVAQDIIDNTATSKAPSYFKTQSGIEFSDQELIHVDPAECEPWIYANRQDGEFGDIDELMESIKINKQLQPALVRLHPKPHGKVKYEVIFGRRRHMACLRLGIPFLVIRKDIPNIQDAIASQDAENKLRNDVSNYSNALLYKRLLIDEVFKTEKELSEKLRIPYTSFHELMTYSKIPEDIVQAIPNIHLISKQLAVKIVQLINKSKDNHKIILSIAHKLGKTITSPAKLENIFIDKFHINKNNNTSITTARIYSTVRGEKLFTCKSDRRGLPSIVLNKEIVGIIDIDDICSYISSYLENVIRQSGYPD